MTSTVTPTGTWVRRGLLWGLGLNTLLAIVALSAVMIARPAIWRDLWGIAAEDAREPSVGALLWQEPAPIPGPPNATTPNPAAALSTDGTQMIVARRSPSGDTDLFISTREHDGWSALRALKEVNSDADETSPFLAADGRFLLFCSNRAGGYGGYDCYVAFRKGESWGRAFNLTDQVNSEFDELDPHLLPESQDLLLASNRPGTDPEPARRRERWQATVGQQRLGSTDIYRIGQLNLPDADDPLRDPGFRRRLIRQLGGSTHTEAAIVRALDWLVAAQRPEGWWDVSALSPGEFRDRTDRDKHKQEQSAATVHDASATALAALAFYGWGEKHTVAGPYRKPLLAAIDWLIADVRRRGGHYAAVSHGMYHQAMVTITLAEALLLTGDERLREPLESCVRIIVAAQDPKLGGWRYHARPAKGDTSIVGWQATALVRARKAGVAIPDATFDGIERWLEHANQGEHGGLYGYTGPGDKASLTAVGMFVRQMLGARADEPRQRESAAHIVDHLPDADDGTDLYYWYYGFLAMYQQQGSHWQAWNQNVRDLLLARQITEGAHAGTWLDDRWSKAMDRVVATAMAVLSLEVYYRYLPMYDFAGVDMEALKKSSASMRVAHIVYPDEPVALQGQRLDALSSAGCDRHPTTTRHGDLLYLASDRDGGLGGFDLYGARVEADGIAPLRNLGPSVNSPADDSAPSVAGNGYRLVFSSDRAAADPHGVLHHTQAEDFYDRDHWAAFLGFLYEIRWWLVAMAGAILASCLLAAWYRAVGRYAHSGLRAKCMLVSGLVHALLLLAFGTWMISRQMEQPAHGDPREMVVEADTLATEKLAMELRESVNAIETSSEPVTIEAPRPPMELPEFEPVEAGPAPELAEQEFALPEQQVTLTARPVQASASAEARTAQVSDSLAERLELPVQEISLETVELRAQTPATAAAEVAVTTPTRSTRVKASEVARSEQDTAVRTVAMEALAAPVQTTSADIQAVRRAPRHNASTRRAAQLARTEATAAAATSLAAPALEQMELERVQTRSRPAAGAQTPVTVQRRAATPSGRDAAKVERNPAAAAVRMQAIAAAAAPATPAVDHVAETERPPEPPRLAGSGETISQHLPDLALADAVQLETADHDPSVYMLRDPQQRDRELIRQLGGSEATEVAVGRALDWLSRHQEEDGHWACEKHGGERGHNVGATALATLCYFGWGAKHTEDGPHRDRLARALDWLLAQQGEDGRFTDNMYNHGLATMALAEACGLTGDTQLLPPLQRAVHLIVKAQNPAHGGWRYSPGSDDGDTSITGWQIMALISARRAGAEVLQRTLDQGRDWLARVGDGEHGGKYAYTPKRGSSQAMTAVGMFCNQLYQVPPHDPLMGESARYIMQRPPRAKQRDYYYWYYGTLALYQHQGPLWREWNEQMKQVLLASQRTNGDPAGSWDPDGRWSKRTGRLISTTFATLSLEVYYRYLPLYNAGAMQ